MTVEGELKNPRSREVELVAQRIHIRCDQPQVLDDKGQSAQFSLYRLKEIGTRPRDPPPRLCRRGSGGHVPSSGKRTEMVQSNHVDMRQQRAQSTDTPVVAGLSKSVPVIDGIAPKLSLH